jgi:hypothetical protein
MSGETNDTKIESNIGTIGYENRNLFIGGHYLFYMYRLRFRVSLNMV